VALALNRGIEIGFIAPQLSQVLAKLIRKVITATNKAKKMSFNTQFFHILAFSNVLKC